MMFNYMILFVCVKLINKHVTAHFQYIFGKTYVSEKTLTKYTGNDLNLPENFRSFKFIIM